MIRCARCGGECDTNTFEWHSTEGLCNFCLEYFEWEADRELYMEKREVERQVSIMTDPTQWGGRRVLPLVRDRGGEREVGFLYLNVTAPVRLMPMVYFGTCLKVLEKTPTKVFVQEVGHDQIMELTSQTYPTFASIIYDGWILDA